MAFVYEQPRTTTPLRRRPSGLPRVHVMEIQRARVLAAAVETIGGRRLRPHDRRGGHRTGKGFAPDLLQRVRRSGGLLPGGVRVGAFAGAVRSRTRAYERESGWREGIRSALAKLLVVMDEEPGLARLCLVEALAAGDRVLERRAVVLDELAHLIDQGRLLTSTNREPPEVTAEGIVGGIVAVLHTRLLEDGKQPLIDLLGSLMSMIVLPYLGPRAASRELTRPIVEIPQTNGSHPPARSRDPLEGLNMRLTYRTMRALMGIAEHPGASNREIAAASGIVDQAQISKLLYRLARLGSPRTSAWARSAERRTPGA